MLPRRLALLVLLAAFGGAAPALAAFRTCETRINGAAVALTFDDKDDVWSSMREGWFTKGATCPGLVVLRHLTPDLSDTERKMFCALWDEDGAQYTGFAQGARDGSGRCTTPGLLCRGVAATAGEVAAIAGIGTRVEPARDEGPRTLVQALADRAGAVVVSGTAGYVASTLQSAGTALAAALGGPAALAGAAVSVVAIGGALYLCGD